MANKVVNCLKTARYNGKSIVTEHGVGEEDNFVFNDEKQLLTFLSCSENLKNENNEHYFRQRNTLWQEVALLCKLNENYVGCYQEDYQMLENTLVVLDWHFGSDPTQCVDSTHFAWILSYKSTRVPRGFRMFKT